MFRQIVGFLLALSILISSSAFVNIESTSAREDSINLLPATVYPGDMSTKFQESTIFYLDNVCRINKYFTTSHLQITPANCSVPSPIVFETNGILFNDKGGVIFDIQNLKKSDGTPLNTLPGQFYKIEVVLEDANQQNVSAAITVLDSLWEAPSPGGPKAFTVGIINNQYTYWFDSTEFLKPLNAKSDEFIKKFCVAKRVLPAPGTTKDVKIEIYVSPNGAYAVVNGVNYGSFTDLEAGSYTFTQATLRYIVLGKWDTGTTSVKLKGLKIINLDEQINSVDEVNAFFIKQTVEKLADIPVSTDCGLTNGTSNFKNALWKAFLYRGYDYYFKTNHVKEVRDQVDYFLTYLPPCMYEAIAAYDEDTPQAIFDANHKYINHYQSALPIMYAVSGYLRRDQLDTFKEQISQLIEASMDHIYSDGKFPANSSPPYHPGCESDCYTDDTFAEELSWLLVMYSGFYTLYSDYVFYPDNPMKNVDIKDYLTFLGFHHLSNGLTIAEECPWVTFTYLGSEYRDFRSKYTHVVESPMGPFKGRIDNHYFRPSLNYAMGVVGSAALAKNLLSRNNVTIDTLSHNLEAVYRDSVKKYLNTSTFRHSESVANSKKCEDVHLVESNILVDFWGYSTPSGLEDWTSTFTSYSVLENYGDYTRSLQLARNVYYSYYSGAGKLFCDHATNPALGDNEKCTANPNNLYTFLFGDALYAMAFSLHSDFDARGIICEEGFPVKRIWEGTLNWVCDTQVKQNGAASLQLNSNAWSNAEAYSPLIKISPNQTYHVSYYVKTDNLQIGGDAPSTVYGRVIAAQYNAQAKESDAVDVNRINSGFSLGQNVRGTTPWKWKSYTFQSNPAAAYMRLRAPIGLMGTAQGTVRFDRVALCEETLFFTQIWGGDLTWSCDTSVKQIGEASIKLTSAQQSDAEVYSPLIKVNPNQTYQISYRVKTNNLLCTGTSPVCGRIIVAKYNANATETDTVTENRIDSGFTLGENVSGTTGWEKKTYSFQTTPTTAYIRLRAPMSLNGTAQGTVWFDAVTVTPFTSRQKGKRVRPSQPIDIR